MNTSQTAAPPAFNDKKAKVMDEQICSNSTDTELRQSRFEGGEMPPSSTRVIKLISSVPTSDGQKIRIGWELEPKHSHAWEVAFVRAWESKREPGHPPVEFVDGMLFYICRLADAAALLGHVKQAAKVADKFAGAG